MPRIRDVRWQNCIKLMANTVRQAKPVKMQIGRKMWMHMLPNWNTLHVRKNVLYLWDMIHSPAYALAPVKSKISTSPSLSYVLSLSLPAQRQIRTSLRLTHTHLCNQRLLRSSASLRHNGAIVKFRPFRLANTSRVGLHSGLRAKKSHSLENGYQTWGGGMKNLFGFPYYFYRHFYKNL